MDSNSNNNSQLLFQQLSRIENTMERLVPELAAIKTDLAHHIKRSDLLEERQDELQKDYYQLRGFFTIAGWILASLVALLSVLHLVRLI